MKATKDPFDIVKEIKQKNAQLIVIDGGDGSGKSTLASKIARNLDVVHINLDDYLDQNCGFFVEFLKYDLLRKKIENLKYPIVVEGICVLAVFKKLQVKIDLNIYVKRMTEFGTWRDGNLYDVEEDVDAFITLQNKQHKMFCKVNAQIEGEKNNVDDSTISRLTEELIRYHYNYKPQETADIIYERVG